jgi:hypothetical protein
MAIPEVTISIQDYALGLTPEAEDLVQAVFGVCSAGAADVPTLITNVATLRSTFGYGPAVEAAALALQIGGGPIVFTRVTGSVAGVWSAVTAVGTSPTLTLSGLPFDSYSLRVEVTTGGALGTAILRVSLDNGQTYQSGIVSAATITLTGTGTTLNFAAGTYVAGDTYFAVAQEPYFASADINTAIDALVASTLTVGSMHVVGAAQGALAQDKANAAKVIAAAVGAKLASMSTSSFRYTFAIVDTPNVPIANLSAATAFGPGYADSRILVPFGYPLTVSATDGRIVARSAGYSIAARCTRAPVGEDLGRVASGPLSEIASLSSTDDARVDPTADTARFSTLRTHIGLTGFYITQGLMMAATGSDFRLVQARRVIDKACATTRARLLRYLNSSVRVNANGTIDEVDARNIESDVTTALRDALVGPGDATAVTAVIDRTTNVVTTSKIVVRVRVTPRGYLKTIEAEIAFQNPAVAVA